MKKRIVCALLALILLIGLVPATAITAAAAGASVSEEAITILKSWEQYSPQCNADGYIGYGTKCPYKGAHGTTHYMYQKDADAELRKALAELDTAVNGFTSRHGLALTQRQHDALVLFSFDNGTAWTTGTGDFQTAVKNGSTGSAFLDAVCKWNSATDDDDRRMVEANMYLYGSSSSEKPTHFIRVELVPGDGTIKQGEVQYIDTFSNPTLEIKPVPNDKEATFLGWYCDADGDGEDERVIKLTKDHDGLTLTAKYQGKDVDGTAAKYTIKKSALSSTTVYAEPNGEKKTKYVNKLGQEVKISLPDELGVISDYVDAKGAHWAKVTDEDGYAFGWVKVKNGTVSSGSTDSEMDITVTVTNSYVNMRKSASIYSAKVGTRNLGDKLRILDTKSKDGFVWGEVAKSAEDDTAAGWVALMYTDYETVKNAGVTKPSASSGKVVARATITYNGYVNVRSQAGTDHTIVGSLAKGTTVDLYQTTYVNGIKWGLCSSGWFCLNNYAAVETLTEDTDVTAAGFANYALAITLAGTDVYADEVFHVSAGGAFVEPTWKDEKKTERVPLKSTSMVVSSLVNEAGETWGNTAHGWIQLFDDAGNAINTDIKAIESAIFNVVADKVSIRDDHQNGAELLDVVVKGTEILVKSIVIDTTGSTIWGIAEKVGGMVPPYVGWINLANKNVTRVNAPAISTNASGSTGSSNTAAGTYATVVNTTVVKVRKSASISGTQIGTLTGGSTYAVLGEKNGWYKLDVDTDDNAKTDSWVYGQYLDVHTVSADSNGSNGSATGTVETGMGIVANTYSGVNIRTGAGTGYAIAGKYLPGTTVEILQVKNKGAEKWGRTEKGWVSMQYIAMVSNYVPESSVGSAEGSTGANGSVVGSTAAIYTGVLTEDVELCKEPNVSSAGGFIDGYVIRTLSQDEPVTVHELLTYVSYEDKGDDADGNSIVEKKTTYWARVNDGYIMSPEKCIALDALDDAPYTTKKAVGEISGDRINLSANETVTVTKLEIVKNTLHGYVEYKNFEDDTIRRAWFDLSDFTKGTAAVTENNTNNNTSNNSNTTVQTPVLGSTGNTTGGYVNNAAGYKYTGKVIRTGGIDLSVRATASMGATVSTKLKPGAALVIYETVIAENMAWGRCDAGWVYLYYVDLTPAGNGAVDARVVYNDNTIVYTDMNGTGVAGSYAKMSVIDIYEIVGKMARTDMGWVNTDNLL